MSEVTQKVIEIKNLNVSFGRKKVIDGINLTLPEKGLVVISGPSGCGKTTFLRAVMGLQKYKGEIKIPKNTVMSAPQKTILRVCNLQ